LYPIIQDQNFHDIKNKIMEATLKNQNLKITFTLLRYLFVIVPIVAGADKFFNLLTDWTQYINPALAEMWPFSLPVFMKIVGVIEIAAGLVVLKNATYGGYLVATWLVAIALTLLAGFNFVDVAVRDLVMAVSAYCMARLSKIIS